jgi:hypothetical protein
MSVTEIHSPCVTHIKNVNVLPNRIGKRKTSWLRTDFVIVIDLKFRVADSCLSRCQGTDRLKFGRTTNLVLNQRRLDAAVWSKASKDSVLQVCFIIIIMYANKNSAVS